MLSGLVRWVLRKADIIVLDYIARKWELKHRIDRERMNLNGIASAKML